MANPGRILFPILAHGSDMDSVDYPDSLISVLGKQIKGPKCMLYGPGAKHIDPDDEEKRRHSNAASVFRREGDLASGTGVTGVTANTDKATERFEEYLAGLEMKWDSKKPRKCTVPIVGYSRGGVTAFHIAGELKKRLKEWQKQRRFLGLELEVHITVLDPVIGLGKKGDLENRVITDNVKKFTAIYYTNERRNAYRPQERTRLIFENPDTEIDLELMPGHHYAGDHAQNKKRDDVAIAVWHKVSTSLAQSGVEFVYGEKQTLKTLPVMPVPETQEDPDPEPIQLTHYNDPKEMLKLYHRIKLTLPDYPAKGMELNKSMFLDLWSGDRNLPRRNYVRGSHFLINKAEEKAFAKVFPKHYQYCIVRDKTKLLTKVKQQVMATELAQERPALEKFYQDASLEFYQNEQKPKKQKESLESKILADQKFADKMTASVKKSLYEGENITVVKPGSLKRGFNCVKSLVGGVLTLGFNVVGKISEETAIAVINGCEELRSGSPENFFMGLSKVVFCPIVGVFNAFESTAEPFESRHPEYPKFIPPTGQKNKAERLAQKFVNQLLTYKRNMLLWGVLRSSHEDLAVRLEAAVDSIMSENKDNPDRQYANLLRQLGGSLEYLKSEGFNYDSKNADGSPYTFYSRLRVLYHDEMAEPKIPQPAVVVAEHKSEPLQLTLV